MRRKVAVLWMTNMSFNHNNRQEADTSMLKRASCVCMYDILGSMGESIYIDLYEEIALHIEIRDTLACQVSQSMPPGKRTTTCAWASYRPVHSLYYYKGHHRAARF